MSQWTHVNASIRIDGISGLMDGSPMEFLPDRDLGKPALFEDDVEAWDTCILPIGSEGSLEYSIWINPNTSCIAMYTVNIFGDLRDYNNGEEILNFFKKLTNGKMIRSGILEIDIERMQPVVYRYCGKGEEWVLVS